MSWSLSAHGHAATAEIEKAFHDELAALLGKPEYGTAHSQLVGAEVTNPYIAPTPPVEEPAPTESPVG